MKLAPNWMASLLLGAVSASAQTAAIRVDTSRVENRVNPRMYAAFMEIMAEDVKRGLTAEMLRDRSFEEPPDYLGLPANWQIEPDERNDNGGGIKFVDSTDEAYPKANQATGAPGHSLCVMLGPGGNAATRRGLSQGHISVRAGESYEGYLWIKLPETKPFQGTIDVALEEDNTDGATYARATLAEIEGRDWKQYRFTLTPTATDRFAKLSFLFTGGGVLYLDQLSMEPAKAKGEVRPDSEAAIVSLRPSFLRWPGGNVAQDYHWQWGVGPRDLRPVWINASWSNAPEPNDFGTDEYLAFCTRLHIAPSITVNVNGAGATPQEAAAWVEYANGPETSKYGAMRAANGHPAPYGVKQWELGNEIFGDWVRGHTDAETYAHAAVQYAQAMRAVDPSIRLIAVGEGVGKDRDAWNGAVLRIAGSMIDYLAVHDYNSKAQNSSAANPRTQMMARAADFEAGYRHTAELIAKLAPGRSIRQIVNEWNLFYGADVIESMEGAVYASRMMNGFERDGDFVEANCISDILNGWLGGIIQASRDRIYLTPQFYAIKMYNDALGTERLAASVQSPEIGTDVKALDAIATRPPDGSKVFVKMSNADREHVLKVAVDIPGFAYARDVALTVLHGPSATARNTFAATALVRPTENTIKCSGVCAIELPPDSVAVAAFRKR